MKDIDITEQALEILENEYDTRIGELAYQEYLKDKETGLEAKTIDEVAKELKLEL